jgi:hypothetical protein
VELNHIYLHGSASLRRWKFSRRQNIRRGDGQILSGKISSQQDLKHASEIND